MISEMKVLLGLIKESQGSTQRMKAVQICLWRNVFEICQIINLLHFPKTQDLKCDCADVARREQLLQSLNSFVFIFAIGNIFNFFFSAFIVLNAAR